MAAPKKMSPELFKFCRSEAQRKALEAVIRLGSQHAAARELGVRQGNISRTIQVIEMEAMRRGFSPDHDMVHTTPESHLVKGTSTLYGEDGQIKQQWVKTNLRDEDKAQSIQEFVDSLTIGLKAAKQKKGPQHSDGDLLTVYPMGDPHIGMYAYAQEAGEDFDLEIAERDIHAAVNQLVGGSPGSHTAIILNLGDYFHADDQNNRTLKSNNQLDVDGRYSKVIAVGARILFWVVERALKKHEKVIIRSNPGNHDPHSALWLAQILAAYWRNEPRVEVDTSPAAHWYYRHGKVLLGSCHGDGHKPEALPGIMASDQPEEWGATLHRYWYTGHIHSINRKEFPGVVWESFRTLAAQDAWHKRSGYRSGRDMNAIIHHKDHGEIGRLRSDITRVRSA